MYFAVHSNYNEKTQDEAQDALHGNDVDSESFVVERLSEETVKWGHIEVSSSKQSVAVIVNDRSVGYVYVKYCYVVNVEDVKYFGMFI